jgi:hypothetical protein
MSGTAEKPKLTMAEWLAKQRAELLKRKQAQWDWEDRSGETEEAIERWREQREED